MSLIGTNRTSRAGLAMSVDWCSAFIMKDRVRDLLLRNS
jgi:hypothetical protein